MRQMDFNVCTERRQVFLIAAASSKNTHRNTQKYIRTLLLVTIGFEYLNTPKLQICLSNVQNSVSEFICGEQKSIQK